MLLSKTKFELAVKIFILMGFVICVSNSFAQTTSWTGNRNKGNWYDSRNWSNGVPTSSVDAIIGDSYFSGYNQPKITSTSTCKSLTLGGSYAITLTINSSLTISGNLVINSNGTITHNSATVSIKGNWTNSGTYNALSTTSLVNFSGAAQIINGPNVTTFRVFNISTGSNVTLNKNITISGSSSALTINGSFNPSEAPTYLVTSTNVTVNSGGILYVKGTNFTDNYSISGATSFNSGSVVDYSSASSNQTISSAFSYATLRITGTGIKTLASSLPALRSTLATDGNIYVNGGVLDLQTYTADRGASVAGGVLSVANNATLKIGGTNILPANYNAYTFVVASTIEYNGAAQTVAAATYGNLTLSSSSGSVTKTFPATPFTISGNLTSTLGNGSGVSFTVASNLTITGNVNIGVSTTFNGGSFSHGITGNWVNNGTFNGSTGSIAMNGPGTSISGSGIMNFNNLACNASQITAAATSNLNISGNLSTGTVGTLTQASGGTVNMTGSGKTISVGTSLSLDNVTINGSVSTTGTFTLTGNLTVSGSLSSTGGTVTMNGAGKTLSGVGSSSFFMLSVTGTVTCSTNFNIASGLTIAGSFSATAGTATFTNSSSLSGTANLYNVTLNGTSLQLITNAVLGIYNTFLITAGTLNVTSTLPNTVSYNGSGAQSVTAITYYNLILSNGNTKTAAGNITVNADFTLAAGTTFDAGSGTFNLYKNWINNGTLIANTSNIQFSAAEAVSISGVNSFNILTINTLTSEIPVTLQNNVTSSIINMTQGKILTGTYALTITNTRNGNGIIIGSIQRTHAFIPGVAYAFEGQNNTILFSSVSGVTTITVTSVLGNISDFPYVSAINREYDILVPNGTYNATLRLHYEDVELNGNTEANMHLWRQDGIAWINVGSSGSSTVTNYVEQSGITDITKRWTCSFDVNVVQWNGSISTDWGTAGNWTALQGSPTLPPSTSDIVQLGTAAFTNQPVITTSVNPRNIIFGSVQSVTLNLNAGGSLTTGGNISGRWYGNMAHTINVNNQTLICNGDLGLSDTIPGHYINMNIGSGSVTTAGTLTQAGGVNIIFTGAGQMTIGRDFIYKSGTFTASSSTVTFNGSVAQSIGGVAYNNLVINKASGAASLAAAANVNGSLTISSGELDNNGNVNIAGNITIGVPGTVRNNGIIHLQGNWVNNGSYIATSAGTIFDGLASQTISANTFNTLTINKPSGVATFLGNIGINTSLNLLSGTLDVQAYTCTHSGAGGTVTVANGATLLIGGLNSFPSGFSAYSFGNSSITNYNGTSAQNVNGGSYGNLILSNAGAKTLAAAITVNGDLTINSGSSFDGSAYSIDLSGNWVNSGTYIPSSSSLRFLGISKTITGATTFNYATVYGSYAISGNLTFNNSVTITTSGYLDGGTSTATFNGNITNNGILASLGTVILSGTSPQTLRLINATTSCKTVNFNGTVSPTLNSTSSPVFGFVNINNTGGVNPSVGWTILYSLTVNSGASFNGGMSTHTIKGSLTNNGTISSTGTISFQPTSAVTLNLGTNFSSTGTVNFGGSGATTITGTPAALQDVIISNTNTSGISPSSSWTINNKLTVTNSSMLNLGTYSYAVGGTLESDGTLNGGTSLVNMTGTSALLFGSPTTTFYDFTVSGTIASQSSFYVSHNFVNNNAIDLTSGALEFSGNGPSTISGTASPYTLAKFGVGKTSSSVTLATNIVGLQFVDLRAGILDLGYFTLSESAGIGLLDIGDTGILRIGGTNSLPVFTNYIFDTLSTVEYAGSTQAISAATPYGNLSITTTGVKTASAALTIMNNFSLASGTFVPGSFTDTLGGNWTMSSGSFTNTGSTIYINGIGTQSISSTGGFNNITLNKISGIDTLASNITINGSLVFILGKIQTRNYTVIIGASGAVSGAAQASGWVYGKLQKNVASGSGITRNFEIGGLLYYSPSTVTFSSVSTSGNLTNGVIATEHPYITTSAINQNRSVNRYWTFTNSGVAFTTASVTLNWVGSDVDAGSTTANFKVGNYNGSVWSYPSVASPLSTSIQETGITTFNDVAIGEYVTVANWTGSTSTNWLTTGNWSTGIVPLTSTNITIPTGLVNYPVLSGGTASVNNITIQSGASVTVTAATLQIAGTITNNGTFTVSYGTMEMNGTLLQTIPVNAFAAKTINNLIVNNSAGVTLADTLNVLNSLFINSGSLNTSGLLILKSSATNTARVAQILSAATTPIAGNVIVERYISGRRKYRLMSSTVTTSPSSVLVPGQEALSIWGNWQNQGSNATSYVGTIITGGTAADGFDPQTANSSLFTYHDSLRKYIPFSSANGKNTKYTPLTAGAAYYMFVYGDRVNTITTSSPHNTVISSKGTLLTGDQSYTTNSGMPLSNVVGRYTLLGNPFASPIDWASVLKSNIANTYWGWDPNLNSLGGYVSVSTTGIVTLISPYSGSTGLNQYIQPGEGFFVKTTGSLPTLTIREQDKSANNNTLAFNPLTPNSIPLIATNLYYTNGVNTILADGAVNAYDSSFNLSVGNEDATKMTSTAEELSILNGTDHLSIDARPMPHAQDTLFLYMAKLTRPQYILEVFANQMAGTGLQPFIKDNYLGTTQPLSLIDTNRIVFNVIASDSLSFRSDRFKIIFKPVSSLPITFISLEAKHHNTIVQVSWIVNESSNRGYNIQRSDDGIHFTTVGSVSSTLNNNGTANYEWVDITPGEGSKYYRIKALQNDGTFQLSKVVHINALTSLTDLIIYPNPIKEHMFNFRSSALPQGRYTLKVFNQNGQTLMEQIFDHMGGGIDRRVLLSMKLNPGMYIIWLTDGNKKYTQSAIIEGEN